MPKQRTRTTERSLCPQNILDEARRRIESGESKRKVASSYGMKESTLRYRLKRTEAATKLGRFDTTFSSIIEEEFCEYLLKLDNMFQGMTAKDLRTVAYEFADKNKIPHRFNNEKKMAGKHWLRGFLHRHPDLSLRRPTSTSIARAMGFNKPQCDRFYKNLAELMDKYNFPPTSIYNMDETGISTVPNNPPRVVSMKGKRAVNKISSAERGTNVTVVTAMSATGHFIPPAFIFSRKRMKAELLDGPPASIGMVSDSSFINGDLFLEWLVHFRDHTRPTKENPILLVLDNHVSHCTVKAVDFYRQNNIIALTLPPHSSHKMQPLDKGFHSALKIYFSSECEKWMRNHPGRAITTFQITSLFTPAFNKSATVACATECFKVSGIYPYNPDIFTEADFLPCSVTERKLDGNPSSSNATEVQEEISIVQSIQQVSPDQTNETEAGHLLEDSSMLNESESGNHALQEIHPVPPPEVIHGETYQTSSPVPSCSYTLQNDPNTIKIADIAPFPKSDIRHVGNNKRKHKKSEILSSSPYKLLQLEKENKDKNVQKKRIKKEYNKNTKKTAKKPAKHPKNKKNWSCVGCNEIYKEPITEDWIGCFDCGEWWHEDCTAYIGIGTFKCDICLSK